MNIPAKKLLKRVRIYLWIVFAGLAVSGVTAFPIESELQWLSYSSALPDLVHIWITTVYQAVKTTNTNYPYLSYGTDWLAFAHIMLAILFIGPIKDPVKNVWVIQFGMLACLAIFPLAFIAGPIRGIPFFWRLVDCSFGVIGIIPLWRSYRLVKQIENIVNKNQQL